MTAILAGVSRASVAAALLLAPVACARDAGGPLLSAPVPPGGTPTIPSGPFVAGQSYFGRNDYVEDVAGNAPVIFSASHGGR